MMLLLDSLSFGFILLLLFSIGSFSSFCTRSQKAARQALCLREQKSGPAHAESLSGPAQQPGCLPGCRLDVAQRKGGVKATGCPTLLCWATGGDKEEPIPRFFCSPRIGYRLPTAQIVVVKPLARWDLAPMCCAPPLFGFKDVLFGSCLFVVGEKDGMLASFERATSSMERKSA
jgi:hypothetical protein